MLIFLGGHNNHSDNRDPAPTETKRRVFLSSQALLDKLGQDNQNDKEKGKQDSTCKVTDNDNDDDNDSTELRNKITKAQIHADGRLDLTLLDGSICSIAPTTLTKMTACKRSHEEEDEREEAEAYDSDNEEPSSNGTRRVLQDGDRVVCHFKDSCFQGTLVRRMSHNLFGEEVAEGSQTGPMQQEFRKAEVDIGTEKNILCKAEDTFRLNNDRNEEEDVDRKKSRKRRNAPRLKVIIYLEDGLFRGCRNLQQVHIARSAETVILGKQVCQDCTALDTVKLPSSGMEIIPECAFSNCRRLSSLLLPNSVFKIGRFALQNCVALTGLDFPSGFSCLAGGGLDGCTSLSTLGLRAREFQTRHTITLRGRGPADDDEVSDDMVEFEVNYNVTLSNDLISKWPELLEELPLQSCDRVVFKDLDLTNKASSWHSLWSHVLQDSQLKYIYFSRCKFNRTLFFDMIVELEAKHRSSLTWFECSSCTLEENQPLPAEFLQSTMDSLKPFRLEKLSLSGFQYEVLERWEFDELCDDNDGVRLTFNSAADLDIWAKVLNPTDGYWPEHTIVVDITFGRGFGEFFVDLFQHSRVKKVCVKHSNISVKEFRNELSVENLSVPREIPVNVINMEFVDCNVTDGDSAFDIMDAMLQYPVNMDLAHCQVKRDCKLSSSSLTFTAGYGVFAPREWAQLILKERDSSVPEIDDVEFREVKDLSDAELKQFDDCLSEILYKKPSVDSWSFNECSFKLSQLPKFKRALRTQKHLREFAIYDCQIDDFIAAGGLRSISKHPLRLLGFESFPMDAKAIQELSTYLEKDRELDDVFLENCGLDDESVATIFRSLASNDTLNRLDLRGNNDITCNSLWTHELPLLQKLQKLMLPHSAAKFYLGREPSTDEEEDCSTLINQDLWGTICHNTSLHSVLFLDEHDEEIQIPERLRHCFVRNMQISIVSSNFLNNLPVSAFPLLMSDTLGEGTVYFRFLQKHIDRVLLNQVSSAVTRRRPSKKNATGNAKRSSRRLSPSKK